jgi:N-acetylornithine carbamoyltransferase
VKEYLLKDGRELPAVLSAALKAASSGLTAGLGAMAIKKNVTDMAGRFIVGSNAKEALRVLKKLHKDGIAFTVDLLGEATVSEAECDAYAARYTDLIAVRAFPKFRDWSVDRTDHVIKQVARYATVPVINLETITHPCQELAHMLALQEKLGSVRGKKYLLTWTYHPKPLNTAVANSALQIATKFGMDVTLLCPSPDYILDEQYIAHAHANVAANGGSFTISHDIEASYRDADVVYCKSWGALPFFGRWEEERPQREAARHFMVDEAKMALTNNALFGHCLPIRRNVKATDGVVDSPRSIVIDEAENRLHVQKALMVQLLADAAR